VTYALLIKPSARKELEALRDPLLRRVDRAIVSLAANPRPPGVTKLAGASLYRIRVGAYRVVLQMNVEGPKQHAGEEGVAV
jgi:mRNA interferase RelE/StbE